MVDLLRPLVSLVSPIYNMRMLQLEMLIVACQLTHNDLAARALRTSRRSTRKTASSLPVEIIMSILEAAYFQDDMEPDVQLLSACSLVCRRWSTPSQSLLFRQVVLRSTFSFRAFTLAVSRPTERSRALANAVVRLRAILDFQHPDQLSYRALALAVTSCSSLYELDVSIYGCEVEQTPDADGRPRVFQAAPSLDDSILSVLRSGPRIRSLKLANWSDNGEISFQLLSTVWPALEYVTLRGRAPCLPAAGDRLVVPFNCALQGLRIGVDSQAHTDFLKWLMANSRHSLRSLELESTTGADALTSVLQHCGRHLESVSLASCSTRDQATALRTCQTLKEFKVENSAASPLFHALDQLPNTIEHVAFTLGYDTPVYLLIKFIKARRSLKEVTVYVWEGGDSHMELPGLRMACAWRGVKLLVLHNVQGFREALVRD